MFPAQRQRAAQPSSAIIRLLSLGSGTAFVMVSAVTSLAAEASPLLIDPLDPRAEGEGPGLVGDPLLALAVVLVLGLVAAAAALLYARLATGRGSRR